MPFGRKFKKGVDKMHYYWHNRSIEQGVEIGDYVFKSAGPFSPFIGCVGEESIVDVETTISWQDSDYEYARRAAQLCVDRGMASGYEIRGNSGISVRNKIELRDFRTIRIKARNCENPKEVTELEIPDPQVREACRAVRNSELDKDATDEWNRLFGENDVVEVSEFNKLLASQIDPPIGFDIASSRSTSCGNTTALLVRVKPVMRCPNEYKGLLIGKGGENIRKLAKHHNIEYIQVKGVN